MEAFQKVFETLEERGMKPTLNITANQAVKPIKAFLAKKIANGNLWNLPTTE